jgi:hypothetical protein
MIIAPLIINSAFTILNFLPHPLPPLKRGGLSGEAQFSGIQTHSIVLSIGFTPLTSPSLRVSVFNMPKD